MTKSSSGRQAAMAFFMGFPTQIAAAHRTKTECLDSVPDAAKGSLIRVGNVIFLAQRSDV
jgi:hypothetical protein